MALSDHRRRQLTASLHELRRDRPIDNAQIERALVAILEALIDESGNRSLAPEDPDLVLRGVDLGR
ncbi:hypothetical protein [Phenylobacterium sp.]|jgi:hypothetical protein|uniref:hypothetical protein n=1 Tax=Phenylobacterium sp. TaxID=1871053 RepID=UPI002E34EED0|nr:hypothetical protein [Phenylobacterium sp.]HEX3366254.1 hypothetical protein [Phenylobacterium sp.]